MEQSFSSKTINSGLFSLFLFVNIFPIIHFGIKDMEGFQFLLNKVLA